MYGMTDCVDAAMCNAGGKGAGVQAPMGWSVGRGCPLPTEEGEKFF